jgi:hypothetical protein
MRARASVQSAEASPRTLAASTRRSSSASHACSHSASPGPSTLAMISEASSRRSFSGNARTSCKSRWAELAMGTVYRRTASMPHAAVPALAKNRRLAPSPPQHAAPLPQPDRRPFSPPRQPPAEAAFAKRPRGTLSSPEHSIDPTKWGGKWGGSGNKWGVRFWLVVIEVTAPTSLPMT